MRVWDLKRGFPACFLVLSVLAVCGHASADERTSTQLTQAGGEPLVLPLPDSVVLPSDDDPSASGVDKKAESPPPPSAGKPTIKSTESPAPAGPASGDGAEKPKSEPIPPSSIPEAPPLSDHPAKTAAVESADDDMRRMLRELMEDDTVVAMVDGKAILWGEVWRSADELPADYQSKLDVLFPALLRRAIDMSLLETAARREGLQNDPEIRRDVAAYEERLLRERLLRRQLDEQVTTERLQALYRQHLAEHAAAVDVTASHIQLNSRNAALATIADLDKGADFAELAHERSLASSSKQGGALGTFRLDRMPAPFAAEIAKLSPGQYSTEPVRTEFGWHVILLEQRDGRAPPTFAELTPRLRAEAERRAIDTFLRDLRSRAQIEIMPAAPGN